jgi:hypothetical protein
MLMSGGLAVADLGAGTARADDDCQPAAFVNHVCWGPNHWCPGDSLFHLTQNHVYNPEPELEEQGLHCRILTMLRRGGPRRTHASAS